MTTSEISMRQSACASSLPLIATRISNKRSMCNSYPATSLARRTHNSSRHVQFEWKYELGVEVVVDIGGHWIPSHRSVVMSSHVTSTARIFPLAELWVGVRQRSCKGNLNSSLSTHHQNFITHPLHHELVPLRPCGSPSSPCCYAGSRPEEDLRRGRS